MTNELKVVIRRHISAISCYVLRAGANRREMASVLARVVIKTQHQE